MYNLKTGALKCVLLSGLPHDDTLRLSLLAQGDLLLADAASSMLHLDTGFKLAKTELEQAHRSRHCSRTLQQDFAESPPLTSPVTQPRAYC